jgi:hypothetical protein
MMLAMPVETPGACPFATANGCKHGRGCRWSCSCLRTICIDSARRCRRATSSHWLPAAVACCCRADASDRHAILSRVLALPMRPEPGGGVFPRNSGLSDSCLSLKMPFQYYVNSPQRRWHFCIFCLISISTAGQQRAPPPPPPPPHLLPSASRPAPSTSASSPVTSLMPPPPAPVRGVDYS